MFWIIALLLKRIKESWKKILLWFSQKSYAAKQIFIIDSNRNYFLSIKSAYVNLEHKTCLK